MFVLFFLILCNCIMSNGCLMYHIYVSDASENFEFLIGGEFLRLRLDEHLQEKSLSSVCIDLY